mmetsp:Transcript_83213/g.230921  ORF Transcript_83213/g.230921 Transcript_83213/m.230921 type:complete len:268 (+) Transcript_83213:68-871(+)
MSASPSKRPRTSPSPRASPRPSGSQTNTVQLVYFNIHARGELTRLIFAAAGKSNSLDDKRVPLFMESEKAAKNWLSVHKPSAPMGCLPYLNVKDPSSGEVYQISGDGPVEMFAARYVGGMLGASELDAAVCETVIQSALSILGPPLTWAGLHGDGAEVNRWVQPGASYVAETLKSLDVYVQKVKASKGPQSRYILGGERLSAADLAVYNACDECLHGPRSQKVLTGVRESMLLHYPSLMATYAVVENDMEAYLQSRQALHEQEPAWA